VRTKDGRFEIVAGERRYRAAKMAGLKEVPCIEHDVPDNEALEITIVENLQRKDLNVFEAAYSLKSLSEIYGYTHEEIARKIGKSRVTVTELLRITDLPPDIAKRCIDMGIESKTFLQELVKLEDKEKMIAVLDRYAEQPFSREEIKGQRRAEKAKAKPPDPIRKFKFISTDHSVKMNFSMKEKDWSPDRLIEALEQIIKDIKEGRIEGLK
jgi:ParB family chromosome partitioning protein